MRLLEKLILVSEHGQKCYAREKKWIHYHTVEYLPEVTYWSVTFWEMVNLQGGMQWIICGVKVPYEAWPAASAVSKQQGSLVCWVWVKSSIEWNGEGALWPGSVIMPEGCGLGAVMALIISLLLPWASCFPPCCREHALWLTWQSQGMFDWSAGIVPSSKKIVTNGLREEEWQGGRCC